MNQEERTQEGPDLINHPPHYNAHPAGIECITITEWLTFNTGNCIKYLWRAGLKTDSSEIEDLEKARWFLEREIERRKKMRSGEVRRARPQDPD